MCCKSWKTFVPFLVTFIIGVFVAIPFQGLRTEKKVFEVNKEIVSSDNGGRGGGGKSFCSSRSLNSIDSNLEQKPLQIVSKPRANYTDAARTSQTQGTVTLRVTFLANGQIGNVAIVNYLPDGLTEQAIEAAKQIKFEPAKINGVAQTVTKQVQYSFTLY